MSKHTVPRGQERAETDERSAVDQSGAVESASLGGLTAAPIRSMQDVFSNWWCRAILYHLQAEGGPVTVPALTDQLLAWCHSREGSPRPDRATSLGATRRKLRRGHIAELREFELLEFDPESDTVWLADDVTVAVAPPWR